MGLVRLFGSGRRLGAAVLVVAWGLLSAGQADAQVASIETMFERLAGGGPGQTKQGKGLSRRARGDGAMSSRRAALIGTLDAVKPAGLPLGLAAAVVTMESGWRVNARGSSGEIGLMQVMPATGRRFGGGNLWDPTNNMRVGTRFLYWCYQQAGGKVAATIGCYNRGPGAMYSWSRNPITRRYVSRVSGYLGKQGATSVLFASSGGVSGFGSADNSSSEHAARFSWRD